MEMGVGMMPERKLAYYRLESLDELKLFPSDEVREVSWKDELRLIQKIYSHFTDDEITWEEGDECENPIALVRDGEMLSSVLPFNFNEGEVEMGAVMTVPRQQNKGYCRRVLSEAARRILIQGKAVTLTTDEDNHAMRRVAEAIGMRRVYPK